MSLFCCGKRLDPGVGKYGCPNCHGESAGKPDPLGPPGYVEWIKSRPCDRCEAPSNYFDQNHMHHEGKPRDYRRSCTLCGDCHVWGPRNRHGVGGGYETFWGDIDVEALLERVQLEWADHDHGLAY